MPMACALPCLPAALWSRRPLQEEALWPEDFRPWTLPALGSGEPGWLHCCPGCWSAGQQTLLSLGTTAASQSRLPRAVPCQSSPSPVPDAWGWGRGKHSEAPELAGVVQAADGQHPSSVPPLCPGADPQCVRAQSLTRIWLSRTPRTVALQAPLSTRSVPAKIME